MRVRTKVNVTEEDSPTGVAYSSGEELTLDDEDGTALVEGGFADELDERGYLVDGTPTVPQPTAGPAPTVEYTSTEDLESKTNDELRDMGGTGKTKAELIDSLQSGDSGG